MFRIVLERMGRKRGVVINMQEESKKVIDSLIKQHGFVTPTMVVEEAKKPGSVLASYFNFDDVEGAAEQHWLQVARNLINTYKVEIKGQKMSAYEHVRVKVQDQEVDGYYSVHQVLNDKDLRAAVIKDAIDNIEYWEKKYQSYQELSGIVNDDKKAEVKAQFVAP